jgi:molybdopterin synthase sulfur carrier subunit
MPQVYLPAAMRTLTDGQATLDVAGRTVRAVVDELERRYPGVKERLCQDDHLRPGLAVVVGGSVSPLGLRQTVAENDEIHFLPAIGGG